MSSEGPPASPWTTIRAEVVIQISEITLGMYLGTTATKQKDGHFLASEVHVFFDDRGASAAQF